jgi:hypothetical protein
MVTPLNYCFYVLSSICPRSTALANALHVEKLLYSTAACERQHTDAQFLRNTHAYTQTPIIMDVRARARVINSVTGTKDLQMANISLRVLTRPDEDMLPTIYKQLGTDFDDRVLPSLGNEVKQRTKAIKIIMFTLCSVSVCLQVEACFL